MEGAVEKNDFLELLYKYIGQANAAVAPPVRPTTHPPPPHTRTHDMHEHGITSPCLPLFVLRSWWVRWWRLRSGPTSPAPPPPPPICTHPLNLYLFGPLIPTRSWWARWWRLRSGPTRPAPSPPPPWRSSWSCSASAWHSTRTASSTTSCATTWCVWAGLVLGLSAV